MRDRDLYARILGITSPWSVKEVELDLKGDEVRVIVEVDADARLKCPTCGKPCGRYDRRERRWRHLDTCQLKTILVADLPRVSCAEHGVVQIHVPWAEPGSGFTAMFEALVIDWLKEASIQGVSRHLRLSWDEVDGVQSRAVARGLARRKAIAPTRIGVDETSFQKRHEYVTVVVDHGSGDVVAVGQDRKQETLEAYFRTLTPEERAAIQTIAMDMWKPYIAAVRAQVPGADEKIAFDKFHVASHLGDGVDRVRRREHRDLMEVGDTTLVKTKHLWLENPLTMRRDRWRAFAELRVSSLKTARAWALKETAMGLWHFKSRTWATKGWKAWLGWAQRCRLVPMRKVAAMIRQHLWGILNAVTSGATNALGESINAKIQWIKRTACGFRNRERFRNAIFFHLGGLDLYPTSLQATHTTS
jgi:transposase